MNLTKLRQMIISGDMSASAVRYLLRSGGECEYLDFKEQLHTTTDYEIAALGRDIVGMKNVGGGYILIGVEDKTWKPVGINSLSQLDTKLLRDKVRKSTGLDLDVDIVQHSIFLDDGIQTRFGLILVRSSAKTNKRRTPSVCNVDYFAKENWGIRRGDIFMRRGDSTVKVTQQEELDELIDSLDAKHEYQDIEIAQGEASPFAVETGLYRLLPTDYDAFIGRETLKQKILEAIERDPRIWIINLHGPGGVGKTALATWTAYEYFRNRKHVFEAILFLSAKNNKLTSEIVRITPTLYSLENLFKSILILFEHAEYCDQPLETQKDQVIQILRAYKTLLILDNMETVDDGRIMQFIQGLPPSVECKILLTSRRRSAGWEHPIQIDELSVNEVTEFVNIRSKELNLDDEIRQPVQIQKIQRITGGLPLAIQWTMGRYAITKNINQVLNSAVAGDSPLLEFSFNNSWQTLDQDAQQALAILSIFDEAPTGQLWRTILDWSVDRLDKAIEVLKDITFVYDVTDDKTGTITYQALSITLNFSRNKLANMGDLERQCRVRYQQHLESLQLVAQEVDRYQYIFRTFVAESENEKRAIVLCQMAEAQVELGPEAAEQYFQQALDLEPRSVYVLVRYGRFLVALGRIGEGLEHLKNATARSKKATGFFAHYNLALAYDSLHHRRECIDELKKALTYNPEHVHARHLLGVQLSRFGNYDEAHAIFDKLIDEELARVDGPTNTLVYAYKTKIIAYNKAGDSAKAHSCMREAVEIAKKYPRTQSQIFNLEDIWL